MSEAPNRARVAQLASRKRMPKFALGELVREPHGAVGAVQDIYADLEGARDAGIVDRFWYERLSIRPKTPKEGIWYGVVIPNGAVLVGENDLVPASAS